MKISKKTKVVGTIGPTSSNYEILSKLVDEGLNIVRMNFSHGSHETHQKVIDLARSVAEEKNTIISVMLDTKGPEIRTGLFEKGSITLTKGDEIRIVREDVLGNEERFTLRCKEVFDDVEDGFPRA